MSLLLGFSMISLVRGPYVTWGSAARNGITVACFIRPFWGAYKCLIADPMDHKCHLLPVLDHNVHSLLEAFNFCVMDIIMSQWFLWSC